MEQMAYSAKCNINRQWEMQFARLIEENRTLTHLIVQHYIIYPLCISEPFHMLK